MTNTVVLRTAPSRNQALAIVAYLQTHNIPSACVVEDKRVSIATSDYNNRMSIAVFNTISRW